VIQILIFQLINLCWLVSRITVRVVDMLRMGGGRVGVQAGVAPHPMTEFSHPFG
jgi:hypothetical protein